MPITKDLLDQLLQEYEKPEDLLGDQGILQQLTKALVERALEGEMTHHLGYQKHDLTGNNSGNSRNGTTPKPIKSKRGQTEIKVPRDRNSTFEPQPIKKNQTRFDGFDEKIISLYARGMTTREIQGHLQEIYGTEISPALVSSATEAVLAEVRAAVASAQCGLSDSLPGRAEGEGQERRASHQQVDLSGFRRESARLKRSPRHLGIG